MTMLTSISLEKYKCFNNPINLDIKPLTVLCGINSSGKSSILKSLLLLKQSYENTLAFNELTLNGKYTDNGVFQDIVYNGDGNYFILKNSFIITKSKSKEADPDVTPFKELLKIFKYYENTSHKIKFFTFDVELKIQGDTGTTDISRKLKNTVSEYSIKINLFGASLQEPISTDTISLRLVACKNSKPNTYDVIIENIPYDTDNSCALFDDTLKKSVCYFEGVKLVKLYNQSKKYMQFSNILPNVYAIFRIVAGQYRHIKHLAPLRVSPSRRYIYDANSRSVGSSGEYTAQALYRYAEMPVYCCLPDEQYGFTTQKSCNLMEAVETWASYLNMGKLCIDSTDEMLKINLSGRNISDVGFGISQGLPVIIEGLLMHKNETLLLEQPEVHLHPKMQMNIADFLIALAMTEKNAIVETHSDHIINRLVKRIIQDETGILNSLISIVFLTPNETGEPVLNPIQIDDTKGIVNWPKGFFDQFQNEQEEIIRAGLEKRRKIRESVKGN